MKHLRSYFKHDCKVLLKDDINSFLSIVSTTPDNLPLYPQALTQVKFLNPVCNLLDE